MIAPMDGRVIELKVIPGAVVQSSQALLSIESAEGELQVLIYLPTEHGKKLRPGLAVQIEPATIKKEEYSTLMGVVREISEFPVTSQGIVSVLQNQALANFFSKDGPPYAVHVDLTKNANTVSGYRWISNGLAVRPRCGGNLPRACNIPTKRWLTYRWLAYCLRGGRTYGGLYSPRSLSIIF